VSEMKKITIFFIFLSLLMVATAIPMPYPVYGKVTILDKAYEGIDVKITNKATNEVITVNTDKEGFYTFDLGNLQQEYTSRDVIRIEVSDRDVKEFIVGTAGGHREDFDIKDKEAVVKIYSVPTTVKVLVAALIVGFIWLVIYWIKRDKARGKKMLDTFGKKVTSKKK